VPSGLFLESAGKNWLITRISDDLERQKSLNQEMKVALHKEMENTLLNHHQSAFSGLVDEAHRKLRDQAIVLKKSLEETKLVLFKLPDSPGAYFQEMWNGRHILGILITAFLISLGAPFWYNSLRGLTNLRPFLANKEAAANKKKAKKKEEEDE
jgi:hypothetical protein